MTRNVIVNFPFNGETMWLIKLIACPEQAVVQNIVLQSNYWSNTNDLISNKSLSFPTPKEIFNYTLNFRL